MIVLAFERLNHPRTLELSPGRHVAAVPLEKELKKDHVEFLFIVIGTGSLLRST